MNELDLKAYVTKADGKVIRVKVTNNLIASDLEKLGFVFDNDLSEFVFQTADNAEKGALFSDLRDKGVSFSAGKEWCPSEVFEYLREIGMVNGSYQRVSWKAPKEPHITIE